MYLDQVHRLARKAMEPSDKLRRGVFHVSKDGRCSGLRLSWDVAGNCERPVVRDMFARRSQDRAFHAGLQCESIPHSWVTVTARCRQCARCLKLREWLWTTRAATELRSYVRTWFVTLTLAPHEYYRAECEAIDTFNKRGGDPDAKTWEALPDKERFAAVHAVISKEITKYLKRVRKASGPLRYLLVCEAHKSGRPHYHLLVHELDPSRPVRWAVLDGRWHFGYAKAVLVKSARAALYVAKYLAKSVLARVRASIGYGNPEVEYALKHRSAEGASCPPQKPLEREGNPEPQRTDQDECDLSSFISQSGEWWPGRGWLSKPPDRLSAATLYE